MSSPYGFLGPLGPLGRGSPEPEPAALPLPDPDPLALPLPVPAALPVLLALPLPDPLPLPVPATLPLPTPGRRPSRPGLVRSPGGGVVGSTLAITADSVSSRPSRTALRSTTGA